MTPCHKNKQTPSKTKKGNKQNPSSNYPKYPTPHKQTTLKERQRKNNKKSNNNIKNTYETLRH